MHNEVEWMMRERDSLVEDEFCTSEQDDGYWMISLDDTVFSPGLTSLPYLAKLCEFFG